MIWNNSYMTRNPIRATCLLIMYIIFTYVIFVMFAKFAPLVLHMTFHIWLFFLGGRGRGYVDLCTFFLFLTYPFPSFFWFGLSIFKLGLGQTLIHLILVRSLRQLLVCFSLLLSTGRLQSGIKFECGFHQFQTNCSHTLNLS